jgi:hypothetical protein
MGLYDRIRCEYPLPDGFARTNGWQTKDLECALLDYTITADGRLVLDPDEEVPFTGTITFYSNNLLGCAFKGDRPVLATDDDGPPWSREYTATFVDGHLESISGGEVDMDQWQTFQRVTRSTLLKTLGLKKEESTTTP